jgi:hypothetical protein
MAKLILSMDGLVLKEIGLDKERLTIGRKPHNDLQIDNLAISGEHAVIVNILEDSFLEDLDSTNGTLVNGQPVKKHVLRDNDLIALGKYKLKFIADRRPGSPADATAVEPPAGTPQRPAGIRLLSGPNAGKELALLKQVTTLGKQGAQVAVISWRASGYSIMHVEGHAFPLLNGQAIDAQPHPLRDHDVVELAGIKMEFFLKT